MSTLAELNSASAALAAAIANRGNVASGTPAVWPVPSFATFASIVTPPFPGFVLVIADETNGGERTLYFFDGTTLKWSPSV